MPRLLAFASLLGVASAGCATWPTSGGRAAISVSEVAQSARISHLRALHSDALPPLAAGEERTAIAAELAAAARAVSVRLREDLAASHRLTLAPAETVASPTSLRLETHLVRYGRIERKWLALMIGSGVVEAAVQGAVVARFAGGWAGAAVAAEELAQEILIWGGGAHLFARYYAPVTLTARLVDPRDGRVLWRTWLFAHATRKLRRALPTAERTRREALLVATRDAAADELAHRLERAARRHTPHSRGASARARADSP